MRFIVERIEDHIASLENMETREILSFDISKIPFFIQEGDILIFEEQAWHKDITMTAERKEMIQKKMENLWE